MARIGQFEEEGVEPYEDAPYEIPAPPAPSRPAPAPAPKKVPVPA